MLTITNTANTLIKCSCHAIHETTTKSNDIQDLWISKISQNLVSIKIKYTLFTTTLFHFFTFNIIFPMFSLIFSSQSNNIRVFLSCQPVSEYTKHWSSISLPCSFIILNSQYPSSHCHLA